MKVNLEKEPLIELDFIHEELNKKVNQEEIIYIFVVLSSSRLAIYDIKGFLSIFSLKYIKADTSFWKQTRITSIFSNN